MFNFLWSFAFFGAGLPEVALVILTALIITAIFMARAFFRISKLAFWLVVPYIIWLMFAFYLNGMIIYLN
jgi:tryptophan-rich sensory protein